MPLKPSVKGRAVAAACLLVAAGVALSVASLSGEPERPAVASVEAASDLASPFAGETSHNFGTITAGDLADYTFHLDYQGAERLQLGYSDGPCACTLQSTAGVAEPGGSIDVPVSVAVPWAARGEWQQPIRLEYATASGEVVDVKLELHATVAAPDGAATRPVNRVAPFISLGRLKPGERFDHEFRIRVARLPDGRQEDYRDTTVGPGRGVRWVNVQSFEVDPRDPEVLIFHYLGTAPADSGFHRTTFNATFTKQEADGPVVSRVVTIPLSLSVGEP